MAAAGTPTLQHGYPTPGPQDPTGQKVMESEFFLSNEQWKNAREKNNYDLVIIGTGFCGLAVAKRALKKNPATRILMIERGTFFLPEHFQNLPQATAGTLGGMSETFPWTLAHETATGNDGPVRWSHGMVPFLGGRSTVWSAWCPVPNREEMEGWPDETIKAAEDQMIAARDLLNVQSASDIDANRSEEDLRVCKKIRPVYSTLQDHLNRLLKDELEKTVESIYRVEPALLASASDNGVDFQKFSTPGLLLELATENNVDIMTGCAVRRIVRQGRVATALETSRGVFPLGTAKLVLAMGVLPPVTLIHNSFPEMTARRPEELEATTAAPSANTRPRVGERFSGHFITSIVARVSRKIFKTPGTDDPIDFADLEVGAFYVAGTALGTDKKRDFRKQFHIQLTALADKDPTRNGPKAMRYMPDVVATASEAQLRSSKDYVVFICAVLGEMDASTIHNRFLANPADPDPTTNSMLRMVTSGKADQETWQTMDDATFKMLENVLSPDDNPGEASKVEYWHGIPDKGNWLAQRPPLTQYRVDAIVHESSTLHVGAASDAPVALNYQLKGTENVFVTGGGLWPRGGSWNPTLTMTALALDLADKLVSPGTRAPSSGILDNAVMTTLDVADGVFMCIKDRDSRFLWANENFVRLIGKTKQEIIGSIDTNEDHKAHDREVMDLGKPQLNFHESIDVVLVPGTSAVPVSITTQRGLLRKDGKIVGVTVCFALDNAEDAEKLALDSVKHMQDVEASAVGVDLS